MPMNTLLHKLLLLIFLCLLLPQNLQAQEPSILNPSGLNVPRFVSLKSDFINVRVGPGKRYPIRWIYTRKHYPVEIIEEFAHWRKIRDANGDGGWIHKSLISSMRTAIVMDKAHYLYSRPNATSAPVLRASAGVIGALLSCNSDWCLMQIKDYDGWIRKTDIWGVTREEVFAD